MDRRRHEGQRLGRAVADVPDRAGRRGLGHGARNPGADARSAGVARRVHAGSRQGLQRHAGGERDLDRR